MDSGPLDPLELLPHRPPFLLVDRIVFIAPGQKVAGWKTITESDCRGDRAWPSTLIVEVMAQVASTLLTARSGLLAGIPEMTFKRQARQGDTVVVTSELERRWGNVARFRVSARIEGDPAAEGVLMLAYSGAE